MVIIALQDFGIDVDARVAGQAVDEMLEQLALHRAQLRVGETYVQAADTASADVHRYLGQCLIHGHQRPAHAGDAALVAQSLRERLGQGDGDVLHGVVLVDFQVACSLDGKIEQPVLTDVAEHVIHEWHARADLALARAVNSEADLDLRLLGFALDARASAPAASASTRRSVCSGLPTDTRRQSSRPGLSK